MTLFRFLNFDGVSAAYEGKLQVATIGRNPFHIRRPLRFRHGIFQASQGLKCATRLRTPLRLQGAQLSALRQLTAVFIHHTEVHKQVLRQHVRLEICAL